MDPARAHFEGETILEVYTFRNFHAFLNKLNLYAKMIIFYCLKLYVTGSVSNEARFVFFFKAGPNESEMCQIWKKKTQMNKAILDPNDAITIRPALAQTG